MKKRIARSLVIALGASIFLYSEKIFANTIIYDPLDPKNIITPLPNTEGSNSSEQTEDRSAESTVEVSKLESEPALANREEKQTENLSQNTAPLVGLDAKIEQKRGILENPLKDSCFPLLKDHRKDQILMLDDGFFGSTKIAALPPDRDAGSTGPDADFVDIARSAYLLSGIVLYGEANENLVTRVSD